MFRTGTLLLVALLAVACGSDAPADRAGAESPAGESAVGERAVGPAYSFSDPDVTRVYQRMMSTIAPENGWERARYLEFDRGSPAGSVRRHRWDRWEGRARVEAEVEGGTMVALFETDRPTEGRVWLDGTEVTGGDAEALLAGAYRTHINDGYWLLMPFKWDDPGVTTRYLGSQEDEDGRRWEVVELAFDDGIGITPQNMYHAFVNMETGRMERWHHFANPEASPSPSEWTEWARYGPIELAQNRRVDGEVRSHFPHLRVETSVPEGALDPPA
jgi:hypothetical protein